MLHKEKLGNETTGVGGQDTSLHAVWQKSKAQH